MGKGLVYITGSWVVQIRINFAGAGCENHMWCRTYEGFREMDLKDQKPFSLGIKDLIN
jgi:hypothetical protein